MKTFYKDKFEYDLAANLQLIKVIETCNNEYVLKMMSHILNAQYFWNNRILKREFEYGVWSIHQATDLKKLAEEFNQTTNLIIEQYDLNDYLSYQNTKGVAYKNTINDVLYHVLNHSNYHRGQVITELKALGGDLPDTNFISFKR
jgi:uncharacterized damage-inducible protein DinB